MGRSRKSANRQLPLGVYFVNGRYVYRRYKGKSESGKYEFASDVRLCAGDASIGEVWEAYNALIGKAPIGRTLRWLLGKYFESSRFLALKKKTRDDYESAAKRICRAHVQGYEFGDLNLNLITRPALRRYMDWRHAAPVAANRELAVLQACFKWASEYGLVEQNPCVGIRKNREKARTRYVAETEYQVVYQRASTYFRAAMELAFLCRGRAAEVRLLRKDQISGEGIKWKRVKGSRDQVIRWSVRLRAAVDLASTTSKDSDSDYLLLGVRGKELSRDGFSVSWQRLMAQAVKEAGIERFTFHDLKARGVTDFDGDKADATGDWSPDMRRIYDRKPQGIDPTA